MQVGVITIDGRQVGTVSFAIGHTPQARPYESPAAEPSLGGGDPGASSAHRPGARHRHEEQAGAAADKGTSADKGSAPRTAASGGRVAQAKQYAMDQLRHEGVKDENLEPAAAMLTGQALAESNLNPNLTHDQGTGYGIYGARNERRDRMLGWMAENGYPRDSLEGQMKYMAHEAMTGAGYGPSRDLLMNAKIENLREGSDVLTRNFARPAVNNSTTRYYNSLGALKADGTPKAEAGTPATPGASANSRSGALPTARGVDPRITAIVGAAARHLPDGYKVEMTSGYRGPNQVNHSGNAADFHIVDPQGNVLRNRGEDPGGMYQTLARHAYGEQKARYPELNGKFAWGGAFGTALGGGGERDLMHFDVNGERGRYSDYHLSRMGSVPGVQYGDPVIADKDGK